jgi:hypothetical protein
MSAIPRGNRFVSILAVFMGAIALAVTPARSETGNWWQSGWSVTGWSGRLTTENTTDLWTGARWSFENSYVAALALGKELTPVFSDKAAIEAEVQTLRHCGGQDHWEFTAMLLFRLNAFPWDKHVDTSFAIGDGLSFPTELPAEELNAHTRGNSGRLLNSVMMEITVADPDLPEWALALRYHHRSGFFRTFSDVGEASTMFGVGLKRNF